MTKYVFSGLLRFITFKPFNIFRIISDYDIFDKLHSE